MRSVDDRRQGLRFVPDSRISPHLMRTRAGMQDSQFEAPLVGRGRALGSRLHERVRKRSRLRAIPPGQDLARASVPPQTCADAASNECGLPTALESRPQRATLARPQRNFGFLRMRDACEARAVPWLPTTTCPVAADEVAGETSRRRGIARHQQHSCTSGMFS